MMMKSLRIAAILPFLFALSGEALAGSAGNGTSGGGNAGADRIRQLETYLRKDAELLRADLTALLNEVSKFPVRGERTGEIQQLIAAGLREDIRLSPYVPSTRCTEVTANGQELERDASTLRGVRNAPICLSYERLAAKLTEENMQKELAGLLLHEHARHFGFEDTTALGRHPLASWTVDHFDYLDISHLGLELLFPGTLAQGIEFLKLFEKDDRGISSYRSYKDNSLFVKDAVYVQKPNWWSESVIEQTVYTSFPASVFFVIKRLTGDCGRNPLVDTDTKREYPLAVGTRFPMSKSYVLYQQSAWFGSGQASRDCVVTLSLKSPYDEIDLTEGSPLSLIEGLFLNAYFVDLTDTHPGMSSPERLPRK